MNHVKNAALLISKGNITFDADRLHNPDRLPNILLGNGRFGGCADNLGMARQLYGTTQSFFWHKHHVELGRDHLECRLPLLQYTYSFSHPSGDLPVTAETVTDYSQQLDLYTGTLTTAFTLLENGRPAARVRLEQFVSLAETWMSQFRFSVTPETEELKLHFCVRVSDRCISHKNIPISYPAHCTCAEGEKVIVSRTSRGDTQIALLGGKAEACEEGLALSLSFDVNNPFEEAVQLICVNCRGDLPVDEALRRTRAADASTHAERHRSAWAAFWNKSMVETGDELLQKVWLRNLYALRCSESDTPSIPLSPGGLACNVLWPFEFPQDYNWMYESYLVTNHLEMAGGTARYWNTIREQVREFTRKYLHVPGTFYPWVPSAFDLKEMERPAEDPPYSWQLHNAAYPLHMVWLYWKYTADADYLQEVLPIAEGVADFYAGISTYDANSDNYGIDFHPCMGQDEYGGFNKSNYLCCMLSAAWSVRAALEIYAAANVQPKALWQHIESKGYCFDKLATTGMFATYEGGPTPNPQQKHPSQLNALAALPLPEIYRHPAFRAIHRSRYDISLKARENYWSGWSLGTTLISSVRLRDKEACCKDFAMFAENPDAREPQTDAEHIQMYETGGYNNSQCYFHTAMAMVVTAVTELFVQCWDGRCTVFPVILPAAANEGIAFDRLLTPFGYTVSGTWQAGHAQLTLQVQRPCSIDLTLGRDCQSTFCLTTEEGTMLARSENGCLRCRLSPGTYTLN